LAHFADVETRTQLTALKLRPALRTLAIRRKILRA